MNSIPFSLNTIFTFLPSFFLLLLLVFSPFLAHTEQTVYAWKITRKVHTEKKTLTHPLLYMQLFWNTILHVVFPAKERGEVKSWMSDIAIWDEIVFMDEHKIVCYWRGNIYFFFFVKIETLYCHFPVKKHTTKKPFPTLSKQIHYHIAHLH